MPSSLSTNSCRSAQVRGGTDCLTSGLLLAWLLLLGSACCPVQGPADSPARCGENEESLLRTLARSADDDACDGDTSDANEAVEVRMFRRNVAVDLLWIAYREASLQCFGTNDSEVPITIRITLPPRGGSPTAQVERPTDPTRRRCIEMAFAGSLHLPSSAGFPLEMRASFAKRADRGCVEGYGCDVHDLMCTMRVWDYCRLRLELKELPTGDLGEDSAGAEPPTPPPASSPPAAEEQP